MCKNGEKADSVEFRVSTSGQDVCGFVWWARVHDDAIAPPLVGARVCQVWLCVCLCVSVSATAAAYRYIRPKGIIGLQQMIRLICSVVFCVR